MVMWAQPRRFRLSEGNSGFFTVVMYKFKFTSILESLILIITTHKVRYTYFGSDGTNNM